MQRAMQIGPHVGLWVESDNATIAIKDEAAWIDGLGVMCFLRIYVLPQ